MAISSRRSAEDTVDEFIANWRLKNDRLPLPILVTGGYGVDDLAADRSRLSQLLVRLAGLDHDVSTCRLDRFDTRVAIRARVRQYCWTVRATFAGQPLAGQLPPALRDDIGDAAFLRDVARYIGHWTQIDALDPLHPLVLPGGYGLGQLRADYDRLSNQVVDLANQLESLRAARGECDALIKAIVARLVQYQNAATAALAGNGLPVDNIPTIFLRQYAGPDASELTAAYDAEEDAVAGTFTESEDPDVRRYLVRWEPGTQAPDASSALLATIKRGEPASFKATGLFKPGQNVVTVRVWTVDKRGHVAASNPVTVRGPAG